MNEMDLESGRFLVVILASEMNFAMVLAPLIGNLSVGPLGLLKRSQQRERRERRKNWKEEIESGNHELMNEKGLESGLVIFWK
ncbi:MAG TPA: hypothetical protein VGN61_13650 [Verrucomicrobiae bacterium]|jgi:hypothetical protein